MKIIFSLAIIIALLQACSPGQNGTDTEELISLLHDFLDGASHNDAEMHDRFWADDLIYTGSGGRRIGKAEIMRDVYSARQDENGDPAVRYSAEDIRVQQYGRTAVVAFLLEAATHTEEGIEIEKYYNTGTFVKRNGDWQAVAWQATRIENTADH